MRKLVLGNFVAVVFATFISLSTAQVWAFDCNVVPAPFDCNYNLMSGDAGVSCPKGDIPYGLDFCNLDETNWLTLYSSVDAEYSYEFRTTPPSLCPNLPQFFGPSSNGVLNIEASGCPAYEARNCSIAEGGLYASKWCYLYTLFFHVSGGCDIVSYSIPMRTVDLVGNDGACDAADLAGFASLIGTQCDYYPGSGPKYTPIVDYNGDGKCDGSDLALFAAHFGHNCGQWQVSLPSKPTMADYPWEVLDRPDMQAAMAKAGVDREFIVNIWYQNGPEQRLMLRPNPRTRNERIAALRKLPQASVQSVVWGDVKVLYR